MPTLTHIARQVRDLQACVDFYADYCGLSVVRDRDVPGGRVVWMAEPGRERSFILVLLTGGAGRRQADDAYDHLGFALESRAAVDAIAARAEAAGLLAWPRRQEDWPVGYYCGVRDPDGEVVEFSYGQPLGPGAEGLDPP